MPLGVVRGAMEQAHRGPNLRDPTAESAGAAPTAGSPPGEPAAEPVAAPSDAGAGTTNGTGLQWYAQGVTAVHCALCDVTLNDRAKYEQHLESKKHKKNAQGAELQALRDEWCRESLLAQGGEEFEGARTHGGLLPCLQDAS